MIGSGGIAQRAKAITNELMALKSLQNIGALGLKTPSAIKDWQGNVASTSTSSGHIPAYIYFRFTPDSTPTFTPLAYLGFDYDFSTGTNAMFPAAVVSSSSSQITWRSAYETNSAATLTIEAQVFSFITGTLTIWT